MFLSIDGTFWIQLLNFAIFFVILNAVFLRPVGAAIRKRREYIDGVKNDFERYRAEVKSLHDEAEAKRAQARREADEVLAKARGSTESEAAELAASFTERA